ncbi:MAG TPA: pentapeptide repeat-containing protein [Thermoanaerobaculia bacterium]|nr:pentapeptide repeat-containing protein [Thermoanaerobaculia bacterium]
MSVKLTLQNLSDWIKDSSTAAKGAVELTVESGLLKDSLEDLVELGGVTGALFKLGSRAISDPTPEQRIAARLHKAFVGALDYELKQNSIEERVWKKYMRKRLSEVATEKLSGEFTWLSIFGSRGRKPGRSWPIVGELADLGRTWVAEMATAEERVEPAVRQLADDARGRIHEALAKEIDKLQTDPPIVTAFTEALSLVSREALDLLAQEMTTLKRYRLFGEIPQEALYIAPKIKMVDLRDAREELDWKKIEITPNGDDLLFQAISAGNPRLIVLEGEMGAGKSCLMRVLAARLAEQFRSDRRYPPVYVRWRDVYDQQALDKAIAEQLTAEYGLPFHDLPDQSDILYLVDGFDEMSSHQEGYVIECFNRLARIVQRGCSVVVAMRSTVITSGLRLAWKNRDALVVQVHEFDDKDVDAWSEKWQAQTGVDVTGRRLRSLSSQDRSVANNPLLLYMLAKYVDPVARAKQGLTRTEVFRIFVDETIRGKLRSSREEFPFQVPERDYRLLLQEMAWLASWPKHAPKCPARIVKEKIPESFLQDLSFQDIRTAFVLHFFEPGDLAGNEFEFQPEGFRHYLLAEWCVRAQLDALRDESRPSHPLSRSRSQAIDALAQVPLRDQERSLLNDIYEDLGRLAQSGDTALNYRLTALGLPIEKRQLGPELIIRLYERVRDEAEEPPARNWEDERVGIPEGQGVPPGLNSLRLLFNYWDQCMMATAAFFRGLGKNPRNESVFDRDLQTMGRFLRAWHVARGFTWKYSLNLAGLPFANANLAQLSFQEVNLCGASLPGADIAGAYFESANLDESYLTAVRAIEASFVYARMRRAILSNADLSQASLVEALVDEANLSSANLSLAKLVGASLTRASLKQAKLFNADLTKANLTGTDLTGANLTEANLTRANLTEANLTIANLTEANLTRANLTEANLNKAILTEANLNQANLTGANLTGANLTGANLTGANLSEADLDGVDLTKASITEEQLKSAHGRPQRLPNGSEPIEEAQEAHSPTQTAGV